MNECVSANSVKQLVSE